MKNKYSTKVENHRRLYGREIQAKRGEMLVMNSQGIFFIVGNFMDYDTYVRKLSDVCPRFDVGWVGEE